MSSIGWQFVTTLPAGAFRRLPSMPPYRGLNRNLLIELIVVVIGVVDVVEKWVLSSLYKGCSVWVGSG